METQSSERDDVETYPSGGTVDFSFEHRLFSIEGCVFRRPSDGEEIALYVPMGDVVAAIPVRQLAREFEIEPGSADFRLLGILETALDYVRQVRPGDSIPCEVLNGTAPWMVEERFLETARARFALQLVAWHAGADAPNPPPGELVAAAESEAQGETLAAAKAAMVEALDAGEDGERVLDDALEQLAQEWSYIEALREKIEGVRRIHGALKTIYNDTRDEQPIRESVTRCATLLEQPIKDIFARLAKLDNATRDIAASLRALKSRIGVIRETRDALRRDFNRWEDLIEAWDEHSSGGETTVEQMVRETYGFAATHYARAANW